MRHSINSFQQILKSNYSKITESTYLGLELYLFKYCLWNSEDIADSTCLLVLIICLPKYLYWLLKTYFVLWLDI